MAANEPAVGTVLAAAARLAGHLVVTPVVGDLRLFGFTPAGSLRVKVDVLQPSGSIWYRGALHCLLRTFGSWRGVWIEDQGRRAAAAVLAAAQMRIPALVAEACASESMAAGYLRALGGVFSPTRGDGLFTMPGLADPDYALGLATVGFELATQLPGEVDAVIVGPPDLRAPVELGLRAGGATTQVITTGAQPVPAGLAEAVRQSLRLDLGETSLWALAAGLARDSAACVVLAE